MFNLGQDIVPQWAVYLHMLPSFPFQRHIPYFTKESNAFFSSGRQEPVKGWTWSSIVACKLLIIMFDPGCMYPLFPESEGSFLHGTSWAALVGRWSRNCLGVRLLGMDSRSTESKEEETTRRELRCNRKLFILVQGCGEVQNFLIILLVNSLDQQKREGEMQVLTCSSCILGNLSKCSKYTVLQRQSLWDWQWKINHDLIWHFTLLRVERGPRFLILMLWDIENPHVRLGSLSAVYMLKWHSDSVYLIKFMISEVPLNMSATSR